MIIIVHEKILFSPIIITYIDKYFLWVTINISKFEIMDFKICENNIKFAASRLF